MDYVLHKIIFFYHSVHQTRMSAAVEVQQDDSCISFSISKDPVQLTPWSHPEFQLQAAWYFIRTGLTRLYSNGPEMTMWVRITVLDQEEKDFSSKQKNSLFQKTRCIDILYSRFKYNRILHVCKIVIIFFNLLWNAALLSHLIMEQISCQYNSISGRDLQIPLTVQSSSLENQYHKSWVDVT